MDVPTRPPGRDEIVLSPLRQQQLCYSREHSRAGRLAEMMVSFGRLADPGAVAPGGGALWPECWGRSFPMCAQCWQQTWQAALAGRPGLTVRTETGGLPSRR